MPTKVFEENKKHGTPKHNQIKRKSSIGMILKTNAATEPNVFIVIVTKSPYFRNSKKKKSSIFKDLIKFSEKLMASGGVRHVLILMNKLKTSVSLCWS